MCFGTFVMLAAPAAGTDYSYWYSLHCDGNGWFGLVVIRWLATLSTSTQTAIFCLYYKGQLGLHCDGNGQLGLFEVLEMNEMSMCEILPVNTSF